MVKITFDNDDAMIQIERSINLFNKMLWIQLCTSDSLETRAKMPIFALVHYKHTHITESTSRVGGMGFEMSGRALSVMKA